MYTSGSGSSVNFLILLHGCRLKSYFRAPQVSENLGISFCGPKTRSGGARGGSRFVDKDRLVGRLKDGEGRVFSVLKNLRLKQTYFYHSL